MSRAAWAMVISAACVSSAQAGYVATELLDDGARLLIHDDRGGTRPAPLRKTQQSFAEPRVSRDGRRVGWLAQMPSTTTSYPLPLYLVVIDGQGHIQAFSGPQAIFGWCFTPDASAVVYREAQVHSATMEDYTMRRIGDGKVLRRFRLVDSESDDKEPSPPLPAWARCASR